MRKSTNGEVSRSAVPGTPGAPASIAEGKAQLLSGIERDARAEGAKLRASADQGAAERLKAAELQAATIRDEAKRRAQEAVQGIARQGEQAAAVETRRMGLKVREQVSRRTVEDASRKLAGMVGQPGYRSVLQGWVVEAVLGLNVPEAEVLASGPEMAQIDDTLLREAEREVEALAGVPVRLRRSSAQPLSGQGVVVTSLDGRTAFNNQVVTRMERYQSDIRKLIYKALKET